MHERAGSAAIPAAASGFEDSPDVPQGLTCLLLHRVADDLRGAAAGSYRYLG